MRRVIGGVDRVLDHARVTVARGSSRYLMESKQIRAARLRVHIDPPSFCLLEDEMVSGGGHRAAVLLVTVM